MPLNKKSADIFKKPAQKSYAQTHTDIRIIYTAVWSIETSNIKTAQNHKPSDYYGYFPALTNYFAFDGSVSGQNTNSENNQSTDYLLEQVYVKKFVHMKMR